MSDNLSVSQEYQGSKKERTDKLFQEYAKTKDVNLRNQIFNEYMYIASILSKKYANRGVDYDDIFQVASLGLIYAIERFDPDKGYEFSSYATPTILGEIKKHFRDKEWIIRVPRRIQESYREINKAKEILQHKLMRTPTVKDIADYIDMTQEDVMEAMEGGYAYSPASLDVGISNDEDKEISLLEVLGIEDEKLQEVEDSELFKQIFENLNEYDKGIIIDRFFKNKSQSEVADRIGVSQMTVSRLEKKIIEKIRNRIKIIN